MERGPTMPKPDLKPMSEFDPSMPAMVHDQLNEEMFWHPEKWREHAGDIAALASFYFTENGGRNVAAFTVDSVYRQSETFMDHPLVPFEEIASL
jgi:hypothetical protein